MPASLENSDTATAAAAQGQTLDKARPWMTLQGKLEHGQLHSGQPQLSAAERQPQIQSVFAIEPRPVRRVGRLCKRSSCTIFDIP